MRKTLVVVLVFGVALLVASPAQAKPVKQRAERAVRCTAATVVLLDPKASELAKRAALSGRDLKCLDIILSVLQDAPDGYLINASDEEIEKIVRDLTDKLVNAYRVSGADLLRADKRLGLHD